MLQKKYSIEKYSGLKIFLIAFGLALSVFLPVMIMTGGYQLFFGDFQLQQIPFYTEMNRAIKNGEFFWNWNTDMGVNSISSYSFYLLGSPFFLVTLIFPPEWEAYLIGPLYCLKIGLAALGAYLFIKKYVENKYFAYTGAILYAFSGFQMFNLVFNHFHDVVAMFPFVLLAFDAIIEKNRRGWLAVMVCLSGLYSYFFLPGVAVFVVIYYLLRLFTKDLKFNFKTFFWACFEALLGLAMAAVLIYPTLLALSDFPRANESFSNSYGMFFWINSKRYFEIFRGMVIPPEIPGDLNFYHKAGGSWVPNWTSTSAWLPLFSLAGVWAYLRTKKEKKNWLSIFLVFCFVASFIPLLNSIWLLFKSNYYTRWWYMPILLMSLATAIALDRKETNWKSGIRSTIVAGAAITLPVGLSGILWIITNPVKNIKTFDSFSDFLNSGVVSYTDRYWLYVSFFALSMVVVILLIKIMRPVYFKDNPLVGTEHHEEPVAESAVADAVTDDADNTETGETEKKNRHKKPDFITKWSSKKNFGKTVLVTTCIFAFLAWTFYEQMGYSKAFDPEVYNENYLYGYETVRLEGMENTRLENYDGVRNLSIFLHTPGLSSFHSVVPTSTIDFYESMGIERDVATAVPLDRGALRSLLSVRYILDDDHQRDKFRDKEWLTYVGEKGLFDVWENNCFVPMGFCYDNAIYRSDYDTLSDSAKSNIMLAAMVVDDEDVPAFADYLSFAPFYTLNYTDYNQQANAEARAKTASSSWEFGKNSFSSTITLDKTNYVFYSIPWDSGWTAYVDGVETEIQRVNVGFMAVLATEGTHNIEFKYVSPGFYTGLKITLAATGVFVAYIATVATISIVRRKKQKKSQLPGA